MNDVEYRAAVDRLCAACRPALASTGQSGDVATLLSVGEGASAVAVTIDAVAQSGLGLDPEIARLAKELAALETRAVVRELYNDLLPQIKVAA